MTTRVAPAAWCPRKKGDGPRDVDPRARRSDEVVYQPITD